ncbi:MAG TPA: trypsin-like peptidase domain-containing protein [Polyangiaceae bacterium]|nr:trypsin-like peptidase domain-containing protein [Polyangiaceae bacterium]
MSAMTDLSSALAEAAAASAGGVVAVHGGRCDTTSGVAWSAEHVVTAAHALERESDLEVTIGEERAPATLLGTDPGTDLAVLRVERTLTPLRLADEAALRVGNLVLAVSRNARGSRARLGILSRVGGAFRLGGGTRIERYLESDIAPTPGLSGSALVDATGALVGVNATGLVRGALVALPASAVTRVVDAIVAHGHVRRAKLGVALQSVELPGAVAERRGKDRGLIVLGVAPGGPAERAGVLVGDVLLAVAGSAVGRIDELQSVLDEGKIGADVAVELLRAGAETILTLKPEAR